MDAPTELAPTAQAGLQLAGDPQAALAQGQQAATALMRYAEAGGAILNLQGRKYVKAEGWQFLAKAFGLTVEISELTPLQDQGGYQAKAVVKDPQGQQIGSGFGICSKSESMWSKRPDFALAAMAQTRATGRALRPLLGWIPVLSGLEATPAEEMPGEVLDATYTTQSTGPRPASDKQRSMIREKCRKNKWALDQTLQRILLTDIKLEALNAPQASQVIEALLKAENGKS